jgi:hypothetical protein
LELLLESAERLVNIVVAYEYLHVRSVPSIQGSCVAAFTIKVRPREGTARQSCPHVPAVRLARDALSKQ